MMVAPREPRIPVAGSTIAFGFKLIGDTVADTGRTEVLVPPEAPDAELATEGGAAAANGTVESRSATVQERAIIFEPGYPNLRCITTGPIYIQDIGWDPGFERGKRVVGEIRFLSKREDFANPICTRLVDGHGVPLSI